MRRIHKQIALVLLIVVATLVGLAVQYIFASAAPTEVVRTYPKVTTSSQIVAAAKIDKQLLIATKEGPVYNTEGDVVLDLSSRLIEEIDYYWQIGVLGMVAHPNGGVVISYVDKQRRVVIEHFTDLEDSGDIIYQTDWSLTGDLHAGGALAWYDNELLISFGDAQGGPACLPFNSHFGNYSLSDNCLDSHSNLHTRTKIISLPSEEVIALGLRNPYKMTVHKDKLYVFDVGLARWDEINIANLKNKSAPNFGWPFMEGPDCSQQLDCSAFNTPTISYGLDPIQPGHCAIIGGPVINRSLYYADHCAGNVYKMSIVDRVVSSVIQAPSQVSAMWSYKDKLYIGAIVDQEASPTFGVYRVQ